MLCKIDKYAIGGARFIKNNSSWVKAKNCVA